MADKSKAKIINIKRKELSSRNRQIFDIIDDPWFANDETIATSEQVGPIKINNYDENSKISLVQNANAHFFGSKRPKNNRDFFDITDIEPTINELDILDTNELDLTSLSELPEEILNLRKETLRKEIISKKRLLDSLNSNYKNKSRELTNYSWRDEKENALKTEKIDFEKILDNEIKYQKPSENLKFIKSDIPEITEDEIIEPDNNTNENIFKNKNDSILKKEIKIENSSLSNDVEVSPEINTKQPIEITQHQTEQQQPIENTQHQTEQQQPIENNQHQTEQQQPIENTQQQVETIKQQENVLDENKYIQDNTFEIIDNNIDTNISIESEEILETIITEELTIEKNGILIDKKLSTKKFYGKITDENSDDAKKMLFEEKVETFLDSKPKNESVAIKMQDVKSNQKTDNLSIDLSKENINEVNEELMKENIKNSLFESVGNIVKNNIGAVENNDDSIVKRYIEDLDNTTQIINRIIEDPKNLQKIIKKFKKSNENSFDVWFKNDSQDKKNVDHNALHELEKLKKKIKKENKKNKNHSENVNEKYVSETQGLENDNQLQYEIINDQVISEDNKNEVTNVIEVSYEVNSKKQYTDESPENQIEVNLINEKEPESKFFKEDEKINITTDFYENPASQILNPNFNKNKDIEHQTEQQQPIENTQHQTEQQQPIENTQHQTEQQQPIENTQHQTEQQPIENTQHQTEQQQVFENYDYNQPQYNDQIESPTEILGDFNSAIDNVVNDVSDNFREIHDKNVISEITIENISEVNDELVKEILKTKTNNMINDLIVKKYNLPVVNDDDYTLGANVDDYESVMNERNINIEGYQNQLNDTTQVINNLINNSKNIKKIKDEFKKSNFTLFDDWFENSKDIKKINKVANGEIDKLIKKNKNKRSDLNEK